MNTLVITTSLVMRPLYRFSTYPRIQQSLPDRGQVDRMVSLDPPLRGSFRKHPNTNESEADSRTQYYRHPNLPELEQAGSRTGRKLLHIHTIKACQQAHRSHNTCNSRKEHADL